MEWSSLFERLEQHLQALLAWITGPCMLASWQGPLLRQSIADSAMYVWYGVCLGILLSHGGRWRATSHVAGNRPAPWWDASCSAALQAVRHASQSPAASQLAHANFRRVVQAARRKGGAARATGASSSATHTEVAMGRALSGRKGTAATLRVQSPTGETAVRLWQHGGHSGVPSRH